MLLQIENSVLTKISFTLGHSNFLWQSLLETARPNIRNLSPRILAKLMTRLIFSGP
jgi:hypothetical protein